MIGSESCAPVWIAAAWRKGECFWWWIGGLVRRDEWTGISDPYGLTAGAALRFLFLAELCGGGNASLRWWIAPCSSV